ncbi:MAG: type II toxin-antitoxin system RelE/ParE family toxin [Deltaproteobacteria bacterium]
MLFRLHNIVPRYIEGQWSIRINDQWRVCFEWCDGNAERVEICDYH